ncbi:MAG TPA: hypothetical protein VFO41_09610 [Alphaproteobacteria bacterium]|nr:hypothetical protein [Alphaproteobacteria bacterium]
MTVKIAFYLTLWLAAVGLITHAVAWWFAYPPVFGGVRLGPWAVHVPGQFLLWRDLLDAGDRWIVDLAAGLSALLAVLAGGQAVRDVTGRLDRQPFGADRWATARDVRRSGLLGGPRHGA